MRVFLSFYAVFLSFHAVFVLNNDAFARPLELTFYEAVAGQEASFSPRVGSLSERSKRVQFYT